MCHNRTTLHLSHFILKLLMTINNVDIGFICMRWVDSLHPTIVDHTCRSSIFLLVYRAVGERNLSLYTSWLTLLNLNCRISVRCGSYWVKHR